MEYKVAELEGALLDAAVAKAEGYSRVRIVEAADKPCCEVELDLGGGRSRWVNHGPSRQWSVGGPIIERERITLLFWDEGIVNANVRATIYGSDAVDSEGEADGPTPLIAAMRAYVASKFGQMVDLP
jgi:hypothetical protein